MEEKREVDALQHEDGRFGRYKDVAFESYPITVEVDREPVALEQGGEGVRISIQDGDNAFDLHLTREDGHSLGTLLVQLTQ